LAPVIEILVIVKVALPVLLRVAVCAELVVPMGWLPKERLAAEKLATGALPGPTEMAVLPPPPHEVNNNASTMQAVASIAALTHLRTIAVSLSAGIVTQQVP
jgi:hypothetical protein